jgi:quercetin dioxygenase-like cupin family protein
MSAITTTSTPAVLDFLGARARVLAGDRRRAGVVDISGIPAGDRSPLHVHHDEDEGFYVLAGELTLHLPGSARTLRPGDYAVAPSGIPHAYAVGDAPAHVIVTCKPGGFDRFVEAVAALDEITPERLGTAAAEHGIEILGPPGMLPA